MKVRNNTLPGESAVVTRHGTIRLHPSSGEVLGVTSSAGVELGLSDELLADILKVPGFVDADAFPSANPTTGAVPTPTPATQVGPVGMPQSAKDVAYTNFMKTLLEDPKALYNSEGYLDMGYLNRRLRAEELPILTGVERIRITDAYLGGPRQKPAEPTKPPEEPKKPDMPWFLTGQLPPPKA